MFVISSINCNLLNRREKIVIVSSQITSGDSFADSELLHIFEKILEHNTELKKDDTLDFWYEITN